MREFGHDGSECRGFAAYNARSCLMMVQSGVRARSISVLLLGLAACKDGTSPPQAGPPSRIEVVSGASFSGSVGTLVMAPLAVRVVDEQGRAVSGAVVRFAIVEGSGSVTPQSVATGRWGQAQTRLTLGIAAGT
jgi:hypothetical protein